MNIEKQAKRYSRSYFSFIAPNSFDPLLRRKEYILNILLVGTFLLVILATIASVINFFSLKEAYKGIPLFFLLLIICFVFVLYKLSRKGYVQLASYGLVVLYFIPAILSILSWSMYVVIPIVAISVIIVMSGILITSQFAIVITSISSFLILLITFLQQNHSMSVDTSWASALSIYLPDAVVLVLMFNVLLLISWISNTQIEMLLKQLLFSQKALQNEKDLLEQKVKERTQEIQRLEAEKVVQLYKFALLGKLSSGIFHDFVNPLTSVSYNLKELSTRQDKNNNQQLSDTQLLVTNALQGTARLEKFIISVKKQIQNQVIMITFSPSKEIEDVIDIFDHTLRSQQISVDVSSLSTQQYFGNPVRFSQMVSNLLSNAIDSYEKNNKASKKIIITLEKHQTIFSFTVEDFGMGMTKSVVRHSFEPLFTTKKNHNGTGIGLSIVKDIVDNDLHGTISLVSTKDKGSRFTIDFPSTSESENNTHKEDTNRLLLI